MEKNVRKTKTHEIKIEPRFYEELLSGNKTFDIQQNTSDFQTGDDVVYREYAGAQYTHANKLYGTIGFITSHEQKKGYVVFSVRIQGLDHY